MTRPFADPLAQRLTNSPSPSLPMASNGNDGDESLLLYHHRWRGRVGSLSVTYWNRIWFRCYPLRAILRAFVSWGVYVDLLAAVCLRASRHIDVGMRHASYSPHLRRSMPNVNWHMSQDPPRLYPYHLLCTANYRLPSDVDRCHLERHLSNQVSCFYRLAKS